MRESGAEGSEARAKLRDERQGHMIIGKGGRAGQREEGVEGNGAGRGKQTTAFCRSCTTMRQSSVYFVLAGDELKRPRAFSFIGPRRQFILGDGTIKSTRYKNGVMSSFSCVVRVAVLSGHFVTYSGWRVAFADRLARFGGLR